MNLSKNVIFFSLAIPVSALFSLSANAEEAQYRCYAQGNTGATYRGDFAASSLEDAEKKAKEAFGPATGSVSCVKQ
ncbi:hypothetical protein [Pseudomonas parakoreensis]|uniref:hypothetical protein n=1 Tax=Pseudomonas parakoreensis TaxID=2892331 RepID=UPI003FD46540